MGWSRTSLTDLIVYGGALPTFLLDRIATATATVAVVPMPPQAVRFLNCVDTTAFAELHPLLIAEGLQWRFETDQPG